MKATELNDEQRKEFTEHFYWLAPVSLEDFEVSPPWGCPWFCANVELRGKTVKEMAENYFNECEEEILRLLDEEFDDFEEFDGNY